MVSKLSFENQHNLKIGINVVETANKTKICLQPTTLGCDSSMARTRTLL